jgi:hypothetical protein
LVRAPVSHTGGHWFESSIAHHIFLDGARVRLRLVCQTTSDWARVDAGVPAAVHLLFASAPS